MQVPAHLRKYPCDDYFASECAERGYWDESSQLMFIVPVHEIEERIDLSFLVIGRPGVDNIEFGYRAGLSGLWAYYPVDQEFILIAPTVKKLVVDWQSGKLRI